MNLGLWLLWRLAPYVRLSVDRLVAFDALCPSAPSVARWSQVACFIPALLRLSSRSL